MKKTLPIVILVAVLGMLAGTGSAMFQLARAPWNGDPGGEGNQPYPPSVGNPTDPVPRVVVEKVEHDFGVMDQSTKGSHAFVFENTGEAPLELTPGPTSCRCTGLKIERKSIPPGESGRVTVLWATRGNIGHASETADVFTNDPRRPRVALTVAGYVTQAIRVLPESLALGRISAGESATAEVALYCYLDEPFEILGHSLDHPEIAENFEVTFEPLPADQLKKQPKAHSGLLARVTVKPGLPLGPIRQTIHARTNLKSALTVVIPIDGKIDSDIAIYGPGWNNENRVLRIGRVRSEEGAKRDLLLVARGPLHKEVEFECTSVPPGTLTVSLGETTQLDAATSSQTRLIIEIPKGARPVSHLISEETKPVRILIKTTHPKVPELLILVSYAIEG